MCYSCGVRVLHALLGGIALGIEILDEYNTINFVYSIHYNLLYSKPENRSRGRNAYSVYLSR